MQYVVNSGLPVTKLGARTQALRALEQAEGDESVTYG
jgi:hypothetical protein